MTLRLDAASSKLSTVEMGMRNAVLEILPDEENFNFTDKDKTFNDTKRKQMETHIYPKP